MKTAFALFIATILYRVAAADFGAEHLWLLNFSPLAALAVCGPAMFHRRVALVFPLSILLLSDAALSARFSVAFVTGETLPRYFALALISVLGLRLRETRKAGAFLIASVSGSFSFYLITNTASWLTSVGYAKTVGGWSQALTCGLPGYPPTWLFFRNSVVSDVCFTLGFLACLKLANNTKGSFKSIVIASGLEKELRFKES